MSVINAVAQLLAAGGDYQISRSVRLRNLATGYFTRVAGTPTNQNVWTVSMWVKMGNMVTGATASGGFFGANQAGNPNESIKWDGTTTSIYYQAATAGGSNNLTRFLVRNFRDPSAWYHLVFQKNAAASSGTGCFLAWVNGVAVSSYTGGYTGTQAAVPDYINTTGSTFNIGAIGAANSLDAYLAEVNFVDGQALTPSSFGETDAVTGVWKPKKYSGTYGNNGFYLNFSDNSAATAAAIGKDYSGNGNNFTPSGGISVTAGVTYDSMLDVPTPYVDGGNGRGNYCTLNPLYKGTNVAPADGNLKFAIASGNFHQGVTGTIFPTSGKWYAEVTWGTVTANTSATAVCRNNAPMVADTCAFQNSVDANSPTYRSYIVNGNKDTNTTTAAYGSTYAAGDIIGIALDLDNGKVWFSKNGTWQASGDPAAGTNAAFTDITGSDGWTFGVSGYGSGGDNCAVNFGQRPFIYTPPTGFKALNTQNLPASTISNGAQYMAATLWTGNGTSQSISNAVNGISFQPDMVWVKDRSAARSHVLIDAVRGTGLTLFPNETTADQSNTDRITSFNSNGFSVGTGLGTNASTETYVAWQWKESASAGFDIVTYTGNGASSRAIAHALNATPAFQIVKNRTNGTANWLARNKSMAQGYTVYLNLTNAQDAGSSQWGASPPDASNFYVGFQAGATGSNNNGDTYVAYLFAEVAGFSKFGSYTGNGSADGTFVHLGFRPKFVMIKRTDVANAWVMFDTSRSTYNQSYNYLLAENVQQEITTSGSTDTLDFLSNGFKLRCTTLAENANGGTYIFAAFAENPFKNSLAR